MKRRFLLMVTAAALLLNCLGQAFALQLTNGRINPFAENQLTVTSDQPGLLTIRVAGYMNAVTDVRYQWRIEVWRVAKSDPDTDGWQLMQGFERVCDAVDSNDHTLG